MRITTVKSGKSYRVQWRGTSYLFQLTDDGDAVMVYTPTRAIGGYLIGRFGGQLSPGSIRQFLTAAESADSGPATPPATSRLT
jgi:hypothetical protein